MAKALNSEPVCLYTLDGRRLAISIDEIISEKSHGWKISRMAAIDRSILRLAVYEMKYIEDVTPGIVINEAVELAKKFGTDESARFVNGVLGAMVDK